MPAWRGRSRRSPPSPTTSTRPTTWPPCKMLSAEAVPGLPEIGAGFDLAAALAPHVEDGDVVVVAHKAISKLEGSVVELASVEPTPEATRLAAEHGKDPRHVQ